jgi:hypothetical protein
MAARAVRVVVVRREDRVVRGPLDRHGKGSVVVVVLLPVGVRRVVAQAVGERRGFPVRLVAVRGRCFLA